jgi:hypothetical protein
MSLVAMLSGLSHSEKLAAMDFLWRELTRDPSRYVSPEWHERVIADRLANPAPGESLPLEGARAEIQERIDARRAQT